ncbi:NAD-dependent epimerase/dehydratase family protein [Phycicoccus mangrovi]|uniref:NAD-dependent epimerase/dehydratase family protein n=2 Tax=Phycicoccus mangrovi TaxID=2840470 RepID=UPI001C0032E9|nr:NAD(P)-dependent oxidoreductase [Phycicoccus mangrovi]
MERIHGVRRVPANSVAGSRSRNLREQTWLITGAAGRIGQGLRAHLQPRVEHLVVADLLRLTPQSTNERSVHLDLNDPATVAEAVAGVHGVVHLAGIADEAPLADLLETNVLGTCRLLEAMRTHNTPRLVYASSNRATGMHPPDTILDDLSPARPDGLYGVSKASAEALTRLYCDKFAINVVNMRIGTFEAAPTTPRDAATWLSPQDAWRAFDAAMTTSATFATFYAVSANTHRFWSLEPGHRIGYHPVDDAADHLGPHIRPPQDQPQAGPMATAQYTLERA